MTKYANKDSGTPYTRSFIHRAFKMRGLTIQVEACNAILNVLQREETDDVATKVDVIIDEVKRRLTDTASVVTTSILSDVVSALSRDENDNMNEAVQLMNAFETPQIHYDTMRRQFTLKNVEEMTLFGEAVDKVDMFMQRYALVHQRLLKQDLFRPKLVMGGVSSSGEEELSCVISPVESLLGQSGTRTLLGTIVQVEEGSYYLEDLTAQVKMDLSQCQILSDGYITENCVCLVEGELLDEILHVHKIGHPPAERRYDSIVDSIGFQKCDIFDAIPSAGEYENLLAEEERHGSDGMFVILSDVYLDNPTVLEKLERLFEGFENADPLPVFIFMGNFSSKPLNGMSGAVQQMKSLYSDLAELICRFPKLTEDARFVFVPGPNDPPDCIAHVLPQGPIPNVFTTALRSKVRNIEFTSNPCRLRFFSKEVVFMRQGTIRKLGKHSILRPRMQPVNLERDISENVEPSDYIQHGIKTIMDQGHLCPLPIQSQPIFWQFDHSLRLFPLPDALILADNAGVDQYCRTYLDCVAVNPGSFPSDFNFVAFYPSKMGDMNSEGNGHGGADFMEHCSSSVVEFSQVE